ncbi:MAG TPA: alpha/beta family hydrolase [Methylomirabilota bacterium]|nr:alpha/beta family hydrolase [Methylomirabilota bacterium]
MTSVAAELKFQASRSAGEVSALVVRPDTARWMMVLGHGAGAGMRHHFMEDLAAALAAQDIATLRYQFPYVEKRLSRPDPQPVLLATVRSAVDAARGAADGLPLLAGGKSMGGRMTSLAAAKEALDGVKGIVFFGFPLHPPGAPAVERGEHLTRVSEPMLFMQGTRDKLADLDLLRPILERLGARATLHVIEGADHSFEVLKRSGRTGGDVIEELAKATAAWAERVKQVTAEREGTA